MVAIKDFEMPKTCEDCRLFRGGNSYCALGCFIPYDYDYYTETYKNEDCSLVEAIPKADYEARLKADMVAMLEDLDLQIDELAAYNLEVAKVQRLIRDKIDKLKENKKWK